MIWADFVGPTFVTALALRPARKVQRPRGSRRHLGGDEAETERRSHCPIVRNPTRPQLLILATGGKAFTPCVSNGSQRRCEWRGLGQTCGPPCRARFPAEIIESRCNIQGPYHFSGSCSCERGRCPSSSL